MPPRRSGRSSGPGDAKPQNDPPPESSKRTTRSGVTTSSPNSARSNTVPATKKQDKPEKKDTSKTRTRSGPAEPEQGRKKSRPSAGRSKRGRVSFKEPSDDEKDATDYHQDVYKWPSEQEDSSDSDIDETVHNLPPEADLPTEVLLRTGPGQEGVEKVVLPTSSAGK